MDGAKEQKSAGLLSSSKTWCLRTRDPDEVPF